MASNLKYFSVAEADALLPSLVAVLTVALDLKHQIDARVEEWRSSHESMSSPDEAVARGRIDFLMSQLDSQIERVAGMGCLLKDLNVGLIDFPARLNEREVYLCWRLGEERVAHWHSIADGMGGRQRLDSEQV